MPELPPATQSILTQNSEVTSQGAYPDPEVLANMEQQACLFEQKRIELLSRYYAMYVIFEDGQVFDADKNEAALVMRAYAETGPRPLFVKKVPSEDPQPIIRTPLNPISL